MASDDTTTKLDKALQKAASTRAENDPWQEYFGRETTAQAVKSVQASDIIRGFSGSWAASYAFGWGAGISPDSATEARQDTQVPTPIREHQSKLGQPGFPEVDFVPYNWNTNQFTNKGPSLIGHPISFEIVGPTLKSPTCNWTWAVDKGSGPNGGDYLVMDTDTEGNPAIADLVTSAYNVPSYLIGDGSDEDLDHAGFYLLVSSDGSNPGSIPSGTTPMGALPEHVDTARFEIFRVSAITVDGGTGRGAIEIHPNKSFSDYFDLPVGVTRHIRAITLIRPKVTQLIAVPGSGPELGQEQTFVVVPPETAAGGDLYPAWLGTAAQDGTWQRGNIEGTDGSTLLGASSAYMGRSQLPIPLAIRQGSGRIEKSAGAVTELIANFVVENAVNGDSADTGRIMRIYHVDSEDGNELDYGTIESVLGWYEIQNVDGGGVTYTLQRVVDIDPSTGKKYFGPGPFHQHAGSQDIIVYFTIHRSIQSLVDSDSFDIDDVQASRLDCLINPRDVERTTKLVSNTSSEPLPPTVSPARADRALFNVKFTPGGTPIPEAEDPGSLLDLGFRMVLIPAIIPPPDPGLQPGTPDWNNAIYSQEVLIDPSASDEKQYWEVDYSAGIVRLSHPPVSGGAFNPSGTGSDPGSNNVRGNLVLYAACVPYSREACQKGNGIRITGRNEEDVDIFSARIFSVVDNANTPALAGSPPYYDTEVALSDLLDIPSTGYFDVADGDGPFNFSLGTWGYQSIRTEDFGGGDVTVLEGVYSDPNVGAPSLAATQTVVFRRNVFFGQGSDDNSEAVDDHRFDTTYGSAHRADTLRFIGASCSLQVDGSVLIDASGVNVWDEGSEVLAHAKTLNFIGSTVEATVNGTDPTVTDITVTPGVDVQEEGGLVQAAANPLNFIGEGVTVSTGAGDSVDIDIPRLDVQDESVLVQSASFLNFLGDGVSAVANAAGVDVTIPGVGDWELVDSVVVAAGTTSLISFSGLDGATDGSMYVIVGRVACDSGTFAWVGLRPNGLTSSQYSYVIGLNTAGSAPVLSERAASTGLVMAELGDSSPSYEGGAAFVYFFMPRPVFADGTDLNVNLRMGLGLMVGTTQDDPGEVGAEGVLDRFEALGGLWNQNTANITALHVALSAGDFSVGSTVSLYRVSSTGGSGGSEVP